MKASDCYFYRRHPNSQVKNKEMLTFTGNQRKIKTMSYIFHLPDKKKILKSDKRSINKDVGK